MRVYLAPSINQLPILYEALCQFLCNCLQNNFHVHLKNPRWMVIISLSLATSGWSHWDHWLQLPASELISHHHPGSNRMKQHHLSLDPNATPDSTSLIWLKARMNSWIFWSSSATSAAPPRTWHHLVAFMSPVVCIWKLHVCRLGTCWSTKHIPITHHQFRMVHQLELSLSHCTWDFSCRQVSGLRSLSILNFLLKREVEIENEMPSTHSFIIQPYLEIHK